MTRANAAAAALLAICFVLSLGHVILRRKQEESPGTVTIRFAHWQLESGVRAAFDEIARRYMAEHPGVRVEQLAIPERVYPNWVITQLVGETAPDLIELGKGADGDRVGRFFVPLGEAIEEPNPYNRGTSLEGVPWRKTFVDGLTAAPAFNDGLLDYYGIPNTVQTIRVFYNRDLLKEITGRDNAEPRTYGEFIALCEQVRAYALEVGRPLLPIAGSRYNAPYLMDELFASQTQKIVAGEQAVPNLSNNQDEFFLRYLRGEWTLDSPEIRLGLQLQQEVGRYCQPGFLQLEREDAMLYFVQGRALMMITGSWDSSSIRAQAPFAIGAFKIPYPDQNDPVYGKNVLGAPSEGGSTTRLVFGISANSLHRETALDFLRFMSCQSSSQVFADVCGWLSAVDGVSVPERAKPFAPKLRGAIRGVGLTLLSRETERVIRNNLYLLFDAGGTPENFAVKTASAYRDAALADLGTHEKERLQNVMRQDTMLAADLALGNESRDARHMRHAASICEVQAEQDALDLYYANEVRKIGLEFHP